MAIHNESLIRVVQVARGVGVMVILGGVALVALAVVPSIHHGYPFPWTKFFSALFYVLAGGTILFSAPRLDRGRVWAFYMITALSLAAIIWAGASVLLSMTFRPASILVFSILVLMSLQATVCAIARPEVSVLRQRKTYAPLSPRPSTTVVIPPPPARDKEQQLQP